MYHHFVPFEDIEHLLYNCEIVKPIWEKIGSYLMFTVTWKIIVPVLGFYNEVNEKTLVFNNLIAFVAYTIYKYKMKCTFYDETMSKKKTLYVLKGKLNVQNTVLRKIDYIRNNIYQDFVIICKVCE